MELKKKMEVLGLFIYFLINKIKICAGKEKCCILNVLEFLIAEYFGVPKEIS